MKMISVGISLCLFPFSVGAWDASFSRTDLIDLNQKPIFRPKLSSFQSASAYKTAKVHFVVNSSDKMGFDYKEQEFNHDNINRCKALGFSKTGACAAGQYAVRFCPYDNAYFSQCCDNTYAYSKAECSYPRTISSNSCGGKFKCYCDTSLYPYTSKTCANPRLGIDKCIDDAGIHYAECNCPAYYKPCNDKNQQGVGEACLQNGLDFYASCECKSGYRYSCEEFGPEQPNDYCLNGIKYYTSCKTCGNHGYMNMCIEGIECSFEQCSGKYFPTGKCSAGYTDISDTSCDWHKYWMPCAEAPEKPEAPGGDGGNNPDKPMDNDEKCKAEDYSLTCEAGYVPENICPYNSVFSKKCVLSHLWCSSNGYTVTSSSCDIPNYPENQCPHNKNMYQFCKKDAQRACKERGYKINIADIDGYIPEDICPYDENYAKTYISKTNWCINNGYIYTAPNSGTLLDKTSECKHPQYVDYQCPYESNLYKSCYIQSGLACLRDGYDANVPCAYGYVPKDICPYGNNYAKECICNPCEESPYSLEEANIQGYHAINPCYSCGEMKYGRMINSCEDFEECQCPVFGAGVCWSGENKKYSSCFSSVLYGDNREECPGNSNEKPIAIIVDKEKGLAIALNDIGLDGNSGNDKISWDNQVTDFDIPEIENCDMTNFETCGVDGRKNTDAMLNCYENHGEDCPEFILANAVNNFQPQHCSADFCEKTKWYLPSAKEWDEIIKQLPKINKTLKALRDWDAAEIKDETYWTSSEYNKSSAFVFNGKEKTLNISEKSSSARIRPMIKY